MSRIVRLPFGDVRVAQGVVNLMQSATEENHVVLKDVRRDVFYGGAVWVTYYGADDSEPVSLCVGKLGKRKKNIWEPYLNWYTAYTLPTYRRRGFATELYWAMEQEALKAGCRRVKSLAGSSAGLALHLSLGHQCWGKTDKDEVYVDSPLPGHEALYVGMIPPQAPGAHITFGNVKQLIKEGLRYDHGA